LKTIRSADLGRPSEMKPMSLVPGPDELDNLRGPALVQAQAHLRIGPPEGEHDLRQAIAHHGIRRRDREIAVVDLPVTLRSLPELIVSAQDRGDDLRDLLPRGGQFEQPLAVALEEVDPQLQFQLKNNMSGGVSTRARTPLCL
jgi:hypothetical protein